MIKILKYLLFSIGVCMSLASCKKEAFTDTLKFSSLSIENRSTYSMNDLTLSFNQQLLNKSNNNLGGLKVPIGPGTLSIIGPGNKSLLETTFVSELGKTNNFVFFQPTSDVKPVLMKNNITNESQPDADHLKIKLANFAPAAFTKPFDIIFCWEDPETFEVIEGGRIENVEQNFSENFMEVIYKGQTRSGILLMLVDHETNQPLLDDLYLFYASALDKRILTLYLTDGVYPVSGTPFKIDIKSLFEN